MMRWKFLAVSGQAFVFDSPRTFMTARHTCRAIKAHA
jgi:hypothetical protein